MNVRLLVRAHVGELGTGSWTLPCTGCAGYCVWRAMEADTREFVRQGQYCADYQIGTVVPVPRPRQLQLMGAKQGARCI